MKIQRSIMLLAAIVAAGCATAREADDAPVHTVAIQVENDLTTRSDVSVRLLTGNGTSVLLGGAPPGATRNFSYHERLLSGTFQLVASTGDGRTVRSRQFTLFPGAAVIWELQRNMLQVVGAAQREWP